MHKELHRLILRLAIPNIISNITIPLLSIIDVVLAGHMSHTEAIGSVTVAVTITNTIYWLFGFIRLGTTGLVAQAYGRQDLSDINRQLARSITMALLCSVIVILCSPFATLLSGAVTGGVSSRLSVEADRYIIIIFRAAPAVLAIYALNGWFIGMQNTRVPMGASMGALVINYIVSYTLVVHYQMGVEGLAIGTCVAQYCQAVILISTLLIKYRYVVRHLLLKHFTDFDGYKRYLIIGRDLMLRSILLSSITIFFTYAGVRESAIAVAANTLLLQFFSIFSYFMDGFAYAGESLSGRYLGEQRMDLLKAVVGQLFVIGIVLALIAASLFACYPRMLLNLLSNHEEIITHAIKYHFWAALIPLAGFGAFLWDGIYAGLTQSSSLKWSMLVSSIVFFSLYYLLYNHLGMSALWLAFDSYLLARTLYLTIVWYRRNKILPKSCS